MARKKTVLCEIAFWKKFSECYPASMPFPDEKYLRALRTWMELYSFLSRSKVLLDCTAPEFYELAKKDERLFYIWKKSTDNENSLII